MVRLAVVSGEGEPRLCDNALYLRQRQPLLLDPRPARSALAARALALLARRAACASASSAALCPLLPPLLRGPLRGRAVVIVVVERRLAA